MTQRRTIATVRERDRREKTTERSYTNTETIGEFGAVGMVCVALHSPVHSPQATEHVTPHDGNKHHRSNRQGVDPTSTLCPVLPMHRLPSETRGIFNLPVLDAYLPAGRTVPQTQYLATALNYLAASPTSWIGSAALPHDLHPLPQRDLGPKRDFRATTSDCGRHRHATFRLPRSPILPWYVAQMSFVAACPVFLVGAGRFTFAPVVKPVYLYCVVLCAVCSGVADCCLRFRPMLDGLESLGTTVDREPDIDAGARHVRELACHGDGWLHRTDERIRRVMVMCRGSGVQWAASYIWTREADRPDFFVYRAADGRPLGPLGRTRLVSCLCHSSMFLVGIGPRFAS